MKDCTDCKYEPEWSKWYGGEYPRCSGACRMKPDLPKLPKTMTLMEEHVIKHSDGSGVKNNCPCWEAKP